MLTSVSGKLHFAAKRETRVPTMDHEKVSSYAVCFVSRLVNYYFTLVDKMFIASLLYRVRARICVSGEILIDSRCAEVHKVCNNVAP